MNEPLLTVAVYLSDGHDPIFYQGTHEDIRLLSLRIRMSWELYAPIPPSTETLAAHSLVIAGIFVNPKHITRIAFVNEAKEIVPAPVGFRLGA